MRTAPNSSYVAGALSALAASLFAVQIAGAQPAALKNAGKSFAAALAKNAVDCKSKLTGLSVEVVKSLGTCLVGAVKTSAKEALLELARALVDEFLGLVKSNLPKAKEVLQGLADRLSSIHSGASALATAVVGAIGDRADAFADSAGECKDKITDLNKESLVALFGCLKDKAIAAAKGEGGALPAQNDAPSEGGEQ
jgi:hypothetical protein